MFKVMVCMFSSDIADLRLLRYRKQEKMRTQITCKDIRGNKKQYNFF